MEWRPEPSVRKFLCCLVAGAFLVSGCAFNPQSAPQALHPALESAAVPSSIGTLKLLGSATVQRAPQGVTKDFGGISGMDRDPATGTWYLLSDDKSDYAPARFYTASIEVGPAGFKAIDILSTVSLKQRDGTNYPNVKAGGEVPDPEAIRFDRENGSLLWSSEGDRNLGLHPFVRRMTTDGAFLAELALPDNLKVDKERPIGVRNNLAIEGLAFTPGKHALWVAMEAPLYQDSPLPTLEAGAPARFTKIDNTGRIVGQYVYPLDPIQAVPTGGKKRGDNGVSEILALDEDTLLVIERSGYEVDPQVFQFAIRIYEAKVGQASNVAGVDALPTAAYTPMSKRLLLDLNKSGLAHVDNIEAACWGPRLPNGNPTLILASDDNFFPRQENQFLAFEITGR